MFNFKSVNLLIVSFILMAMTLLMSVMHVVIGRYLNLAASFPAVAVAFISVVLLFRGRFHLASTTLFVLLSLTPFSISIIPEISGPRDLFMYSYFSLPVLALVLIVGYSRRQLWSLAGVSLALGALFFMLRLSPFLETVPGNTVSATIFAVIYFVMTTAFLSISFRVERRILQALNKNRRDAAGREERLQGLLSATGGDRAPYIGAPGRLKPFREN